MKTRVSRGDSIVELDGSHEEVANVLRALGFGTNHGAAVQQAVGGEKSPGKTAKSQPKIPTREQIRDYIESKPNARHSVNEVNSHFCNPLLKGGSKEYNALFHGLLWARKKVLEENHGKKWGVDPSSGRDRVTELKPASQ